ncbi:hypothetical protein [Leptolyngbya sp. FACHB-36]|uniref:hypothetical protein n=1 Tax=Leptolyngbya sp. FACHB-36 TaxID=2692808 RepID=UPI0016817161|nr:hypothetical protein [Leptolyngbya sp. FACHB-36]
MQISESWAGVPLFYEKLKDFVAIVRRVGEREITILVEPVQPGFLHACTPDDIVQVLSLLPSKDVESISLVVLRQPKRKERLLSPVWGRLQYWSEIHQYTGVAIHLEAQPVETVQRWSKSLTPDEIQELERLAQDGHRVVSERRYYAVHTSLESNRSTQLYRTLPHEVGHYVDYLESVQDDENNDLYWSKPDQEKEAFAHRYATQFWEREKVAGHVPFERILNEEKLVAEGLALSWFTPSSNSVKAD